MIRSSLAELADGSLRQLERAAAEPHPVYVVRDGDLVLYVGRAARPSARLWSHLCGHWDRGPDELGCLVIANLPAALAWRVELLTVGETRGADDGETLDLEGALIRALRPCLNHNHNPDRRELPPHYGQSRDLAYAARLLPYRLPRERWRQLAAAAAGSIRAPADFDPAAGTFSPSERRAFADRRFADR
jgi:hypothetical protein